MSAVIGLPAGRGRLGVELGRPFVHHAFDYLVIGGGLSLAFTAWLKLGGAECVLPFLFAFLGSKEVGIEWLLPERLLAHPTVDLLRARLLSVLGTLSFAAPVALFVRCQSPAGRMPLISLLAMLANAVWWVTLTYMDAFVWAGFSYAESLLLVVAVVNLHHFIVDAYIWRLRKDPNYAVVKADVSAA